MGLCITKDKQYRKDSDLQARGKVTIHVHLKLRRHDI